MSFVRVLLCIVILSIHAGVAFAAGGGNGSSGIGNIRIDGRLSAQFPLSRPVVKKGDEIVDVKSGEKLFKVEKVDRALLDRLYGEQLVRAKLGSVEGYEYQPKVFGGKAGEQNLWIICPKDQTSCVRMTPLSRTHSGVTNVIGALEQK